MFKSRFLSVVLVLFSISLMGCIKDVKDAIDDSVDAIECANLLSQINNDEGNKPCSELVADINNILNTCDEFLSQEEKDDLNFAKENCQDN